MKKLTTEEFIKRAARLYGNSYDFSKVEYINSSTKICITCREHGDFWITPNNFLRGHKCAACSGRQRITKDVFIQRSIIRHRDTYDYSKVRYNGLATHVEIICPKHGSFWQKPSLHLNGNGCQKCFATPKSNTEEFIRKAVKLYGDKYDYSKVKYEGNKVKVCVICKKHGEWWITPNNHLRSHGCPGCFGTPRLSNEEFILKARETHGDRYEYSQSQYTGGKNKIEVICSIHGSFWQTASTHINGSGCPNCMKVAKITQDSFVARSSAKHKGKYDYSRVSYINSDSRVCIICPDHGEFWQRPHYHMRGGNCPKCVGGVRLTTDEFIVKASDVHDEFYSYKKVKYLNTATKVCITCPEHGDFWQTPNNHLFGAGCPVCPQSMMEGKIRQILKRNNIEFEQEKSFDWLTDKRKMYLDFFLPDYSIAIECQGRQHFIPVSHFGGEEFFKRTLERDKLKWTLCSQKGITILYYSNCNIDYPYPVFESLRLLIKAIKHNGKIENHLLTKPTQLSIFDLPNNSNNE